MRPVILMVTFGVLLIVIAGIALAPLWLEGRLEEQLAELTRLPVRVESVQLNLLSGSATVEQLEIGNDLVTVGRIEANLAYLPLFEHAVVVQSAAIEAARIRLRWRGDELELPPLNLPAQSESGSGTAQQWRFLLESGRVTNTQLVVEERDVTQRLQIDDLTISGLAPEGGEPIPVKLEGSINDSSIRFDGEATLAQGERSLEGTLDLDPLSLAALHNHLPARVSGEVALRGLKIDAQVGSALQLALNGRIEVLLPGVEVAVLRAGSERLDWSGSLSVEVPGGSGANVGVSGDLAVIRLQASGSEPLLQADAVVLSGIDVKMGPAEGRRITVASLRAGDLELSVTRGEDGTLLIPATSGASVDAHAASANTSEGSATNEAPATTIEIGSIELTGASKIEFNDRSVTPPVALTLTDLHVSGSRLGTATPFTFSLEARQGEAAELAGGGTISGMLSATPVGNATIDLTGFDLNQIAPYLTVAQICSGRADLHTKLEMDAEEVRSDNHVVIDQLRVDQTQKSGEGGGMPISVALSLLKDKNDHIDLDVPVVSKREDLAVDPSDVIRVALRNATRKAALAYTAVALQPFGSIILLKNLAQAASRPQLEAVSFPAGGSQLSASAADYVAKIGKLLGDRPELKLTLCGVATAADKEQLQADLLEEREAQKAAAAAQATPNIADEIAAEIRESLPPPPPPEVSPGQMATLAQSRRQAVLEALKQQGIEGARLLGCSAKVGSDDSKPRVDLLL